MIPPTEGGDMTLGSDLGSGYRWMWLSDGDGAIGHDGCRSWHRIDLTSGQYHQLISREPLHIEASVLLAPCGDHGFIRDGRWVTA